MKLHGGSTLEYDWLVLAVGSQTNTFGIPGVKEHAVTFWSLDDVNAVRPPGAHGSDPPQSKRLCTEARAAGRGGPVQAGPRF